MKIGNIQIILSKATLSELNLAIRAWKIYGKYFVRINSIIYSIKQKIRSKNKC